MLILKRKIGESVIIGEDIEIIILEKDGDSVKIGIRAPMSFSVYRKEIFEEIKASNQSALQTSQSINLLKQYYKKIKKLGENKNLNK